MVPTFWIYTIKRRHNKFICFNRKQTLYIPEWFFKTEIVCSICNVLLNFVMNVTESIESLERAVLLQFMSRVQKPQTRSVFRAHSKRDISFADIQLVSFYDTLVRILRISGIFKGLLLTYGIQFLTQHEVLNAGNTVFWHVTLCTRVEICRRFGGTYSHCL
jgi:hypothetical protein